MSESSDLRRARRKRSRIAIVMLRVGSEVVVDSRKESQVAATLAFMFVYRIAAVVVDVEWVSR